MMDDYLKTMRIETDLIVNIALELKSVGNAFYVVGNREMGELLVNMSSDLMNSQVNINKAVGAEINKQYKESFQSAANTVKACLAVGDKT